MNDRPTYTKWRRRTGGLKVCGECGRRHAPVMRIDGKAVRVKTCIKCGAALPARLIYPKKGAVRWYVRDTDPVGGSVTDHKVESAEDADEFIRCRQRDWTRDPIQQRLLEYASALVHQIDAEIYDDAINELITRLGGDASTRSLKPIGWDEAREMICEELLQKGRADQYVDAIRTVTADFRTITGVTEWSKVDLDAIAEYRRVRLAGGWERNGRTARAICGRTLNSDLRSLSTFLTRAQRKGWVVRNVLEKAPDERVKVEAVRVTYMPDEDLQSLIDGADEAWLRAFMIIAYYTGARRGDILRLEWDRDVDLDGTKVASEGREGPHVYIRGNKADTPHWMPLHPAAVAALNELRHDRVVDRRVFPVRCSKSPGAYVSRLFTKLCIRLDLTKEVLVDGETLTKNLWTLHSLRKKANTDLRNRGASAKERATMLGHKTTDVNEAHYEATLPGRERELVDSLPVFGMAG